MVVKITIQAWVNKQKVNPSRNGQLYHICKVPGACTLLCIAVTSLRLITLVEEVFSYSCTVKITFGTRCKYLVMRLHKTVRSFLLKSASLFCLILCKESNPYF